MPEAVTFVFLGRFEPASFAAFALHRAGRLSLSLHLTDVALDRVEVSVSGSIALIDAFEAACSLGPIDCLVLDVIREAVPA